tara:strand:- start:353 stop:712 length:360 start_codon:yes stop_codon:yes gene_type:complete
MPDLAKLDMAEVELVIKDRLERNGRKRLLDECRQLQLIAYVLAGGGWLGSTAAKQPVDFYVDDRTSLPRKEKRKAERATQVLALYAKVLDLNPRDLDPSHELFPGEYRSFMDTHHCGIF